jgi:hypothetical protein
MNNFLIKKWWVYLFFIVIFPNLVFAALIPGDSASAILIDSSTNGGSAFCPADHPLVIGANYYNYRPDNLACTTASSSQVPIPVNVANPQYIDGTTNDASFFCPPDKPVVCGLKNKPNENSKIDALYCCEARDIIVPALSLTDPSVVAQKMGELQSTTIWCPTGKIMCGGQNTPYQNDEMWVIYCCDYENEGTINGACILNTDEDRDGATNCADMDCNNKVGDIVGGVSKYCRYSNEAGAGTATADCSDGFDNDRNEGTDLADPDCNDQQGILCRNVGGDWTSGLLTQATATNGNDGCCGNDPLLTAPPFSYDYGDFLYSATLGNFMCYNNISDVTRLSEDTPSDPAWGWLDANSNSYKIVTLNKSSGKTIDIISNSENWFYTGTDAIVGATAIDILDTFTGPAGGTGNIQCSDYFTGLFRDQEHIFVNRQICSGAEPCCRQNAGVNLSFPREEIDKCFGDNQCSIGTTLLTTDALCTYAAMYFPEICFTGGSTIDPDFIDANLCKFNPAVCLGFDTFSSSEACDAQTLPTGYNSELCINGEQYCHNGISYDTNDVLRQDDRCCIGMGADCVSIMTIDQCFEYGGIIYDSALDICMEDIFLDDGQHCCLTETVPNIFASGIYGLDVPEAYIYYREDGNDYLGQCCIDNTTSSCRNWNIVDSIYIDDKKGRVFGLGNSFHTVDNYDYYEESLGYIFDQVLRQPRLLPGSNQLIILSEAKKISSFSYIEFDITYNQEGGKNLRLSINGVLSAKAISEYSNNGDGLVRWHHIRIPLDYWQNQGITQITNLAVHNPSLDSVGLMIDDVILVSGPPQYATNSPEYYCTGGWFSWITDMDPNQTIDFTDVKKYGPYKQVCDSIQPYFWTGKNCCGDDTLGTNYGEFFSDINSGCFNGSNVKKRESVSHAKGVYETYDEFENYIYKGLLYNVTSFVSCQGITNSEALAISYNGTDVEGLLVSPNEFVSKQCQVEGKYYCFNQAWRQSVPGINTYDYITQEYDTVPTELYLKSSPPGIILVKDGDFGNNQRYTP